MAGAPGSRGPRIGVHTAVSRYYRCSGIAVLKSKVVKQVAGVYVVRCFLGTVAGHWHVLDKAVGAWRGPSARRNSECRPPNIA